MRFFYSKTGLSIMMLLWMLFLTLSCLGCSSPVDESWAGQPADEPAPEPPDDEPYNMDSLTDLEKRIQTAQQKTTKIPLAKPVISTKIEQLEKDLAECRVKLELMSHSEPH